MSDESPKKTKFVPAFARPPFAEEVFTAEFKKSYDQSPGWSRHFIKKFVETGNIELAAKQAGITVKDIDPKLASQRQFSELLDSHGLSNEDLVMYLFDCVKADTLVRDKHGKLHKTVDLKTRLEAIKVVLNIKGELGNKKPERSHFPSEELFANTDPEVKD